MMTITPNNRKGSIEAYNTAEERVNASVLKRALKRGSPPGGLPLRYTLQKACFWHILMGEDLRMPTSVKIASAGYPYSMGKVYPGASFASLSVPLTQNILPVQNDGTTPDKGFNGIFIQAHPDNSDVIYVCNSAAAPDLTAYTNVLAVLTAGASYPRGKEWANNRDISRLFIGANNAVDFVIISIDAF